MIAETLLMTSLALKNPELDMTLPEPPQAEIHRISQEVQKRKAFQFVHVDNIPTERELRISKILHTMDVMTTIYGLKNADVKEGNLLLPEDPSNAQLIGQKTILLTLVHHNFEAEQIVVMNWATGIAVARNIYIINKYD
jgi:hypothetical protein